MNSKGNRYFIFSKERLSVGIAYAIAVLTITYLAINSFISPEVYLISNLIASGALVYSMHVDDKKRVHN
jgi:hypothetical protein